MLSNLWGAQSNICIYLVIWCFYEHKHFLAVFWSPPTLINTLLLCFLVLGQPLNSGALSLVPATTGNHSAHGNSEAESEHRCGLKNHNQDTQQPSLQDITLAVIISANHRHV